MLLRAKNCIYSPKSCKFAGQGTEASNLTEFYLISAAVEKVDGINTKKLLERHDLAPKKVGLVRLSPWPEWERGDGDAFFDQAFGFFGIGFAIDRTLWSIAKMH